ncbi:MAG: hypothetical protein D6736_09160 [Nitrospinota bacterium]|nr:MAG: hypothetical protein D6736_09160 [Nitrospinota bacterium]
MMKTGSRERILQTIRQILDGEREAASEERPRPQPVQKEPSRPQEALLASLEREWTLAGGKFVTVQGLDAVGEYLGQVIKRHQVEQIVRWSTPLLDRLDAMLNSPGLSVSISPAGKGEVETVEKAGLGITEADYALADSGTLVLLSGRGRGRLVSLLPPVHVALLRPEKVLPGLDDLFRRLQEGEGGRRAPADWMSCITFITGPSRSADIELSLSVGVHGPGEVHLLLWREEKGEE